MALTGAGISAESGIPTFRGAGGLWRNFRAEDLATPQAFARDPKLVWEWYDWRRVKIAEAVPNAAHRALAAHEGLTLITQNVDGLHDLAGSRDVLKIHGDIWTRRCTQCGHETHDRVAPLPAYPPLCPKCGGIQRPGVVWFGEGLPGDVWDAAEDAARRARVLLVIGTSAQVYPAAGLIPLAKRAGAKIVEVNIERSAASEMADEFHQGPASEIVPGLLASL
ncbi:NAD-dependent protein deacylase [Bryobacterales bacterium F-183]|nr:NAD-dependent protein deacylase [Bryobacterales bacterium F-183]